MIQHPSFVVEPWRIRETALDLDVLAQSESIFALSNGHLGLRGNLDGELQTHERVLDLRAGTLERRVEWISPAGGAVRVSSVRLVSLTQRSIAAISYEVEPLRAAARLVVQSELVANEPQSVDVSQRDPRAPAVLDTALRSEGMRTFNGRLSFAPRLPDGLTRLVLNVRYRDRRLQVTATPMSASYTLLSGQPLQLAHHGEPLSLNDGVAITRPIPPLPRQVPPTQPPGRAPARRRGPNGSLNAP